MRGLKTKLRRREDQRGTRGSAKVEKWKGVSHNNGRVGTACRPSLYLKVGAWLRRALHARRARQSLAPTRGRKAAALGQHAVLTLPVDARRKAASQPLANQPPSQFSTFAPLHRPSADLHFYTVSLLPPFPSSPFPRFHFCTVALFCAIPYPYPYPYPPIPLCVLCSPCFLPHSLLRPLSPLAPWSIPVRRASVTATPFLWVTRCSPPNTRPLA